MRLIHLHERVGHAPETEGGEPAAFDPRADYDSVMDEEGDLDDVEALISRDTAVTAVDAVSGARLLAEGMAALAEAVAEPYTLRTTADVPLLVEALQQHLEAAAGVSTGLGAWLRAAHERGEAGDPAVLVARLTELAGQIHAVATRMQVDTIPEDRSPAMDPATIAEQVRAALQRRGVAVGGIVVAESGINWELPDGLVLSVNQEDWKLLTPAGRDDAYTELVEAGLPFPSYAHPAQIAGIIADWLTQQTPPVA